MRLTHCTTARCCLTAFVVIVCAVAAVALTTGAVQPRASAARLSGDSSEAQRTVLWISIDGVRPDYVDRGEVPVLDRLMREGAYSRELVPVFPSLTFPSHVSQATGVKVREHGIPGNSFIDIDRQRTYRYPPWANMLRAEPIWLTAARQGVRVAVYDWPLSHSQRDEITTEYFGQRYEGRLTDRERIMVLINEWANDHKRGNDDPPLRLLMGYVVGPDSVGHEFGPDAREPVEKLEAVDQLLGEVITKAIQIWEHNNPRAATSRRAAADKVENELWVILTTDHGMSAVHTLVHIGHLAGLQGMDDVETVTSGNTGHIFFRDRETVKNEPERIAAMLDRINAHPFASAWKRSDLPEQWRYDHPTRTGDIVVVIDTGHTFSTRPASTTAPAAEHGGPLGMHGYDARTNPEMNGLMVVWRYPKQLGGTDLGRVHSLQLHTTVARLLGIEPAEGAHPHIISAMEQFVGNSPHRGLTSPE